MLYFEYKIKPSSLFSYFHYFRCSCCLRSPFFRVFLAFSFFFQGFFKSQVCVSFPMAPLLFPQVEKIVSRVTPTSLHKTFHRSFLSIKTHYTRAPNLNEWIILFFLPLPPDLVDAQSKRRLVFYLKQITTAFLSPFLGFSTLFLDFTRSLLECWLWIQFYLWVRRG